MTQCGYIEETHRCNGGTPNPTCSPAELKEYAWRTPILSYWSCHEMNARTSPTGIPPSISPGISCGAHLRLTGADTFVVTIHYDQGEAACQWLVESSGVSNLRYLHYPLTPFEEALGPALLSDPGVTSP